MTDNSKPDLEYADSVLLSYTYPYSDVDISDVFTAAHEYKTAYQALQAENENLQKIIDDECKEEVYEYSQYCQSLHYGYDKQIQELEAKIKELEHYHSIKEMG